MNLTCYVVDDETHAVDVLSRYVEQTAGLELIGCSTNPLHALNAVTVGRPPDITFLDVEMPELSGMEFATLADQHTRIVFTTAYREFAVEAFEKEASDFLLKPISYTRFRKCVERIRRTALPERAPSDHFFVKTEIKGRTVKIKVADIIYVEGAQNYVKIHTDAGPIMPYLTLTEMEQFLPGRQFSRVHLSFIVNNERVRVVEPGRIILDNDTTLNLGRSYKDAFLARMAERLLQSRRKR